VERPFTSFEIDVLRKTFFDRGYLVLDSYIPTVTLDNLIHKLDPYWNSKTVPIGLLNQELQEANLKRGSNRLQDLWEVIPEVRSIAKNTYTLKVLEAIFGKSPRPFQTLNFQLGTEQAIHSDSVHFNSEPFGLMCGVWVALEDINYDQGPLVYYPESHKLPEITKELIGFVPTEENYSKLVSYWEEIIQMKSFQQELGILKKGQSIIWHAHLLHGGYTRTDKSKTRNSQVTHYYFEGARPWRQLQSVETIKYFEPNWIT
jgi:hypothetical protein